MTKKRFYKLQRALAVELGMMNKFTNGVCTRMKGINRKGFDDRGYAYIWSILNIDTTVGKKVI